MKLSKEVTDSTLRNLLRVADALVLNTAALLLSLSQQNLLILVVNLTCGQDERVYT